MTEIRSITALVALSLGALWIGATSAECSDFGHECHVIGGASAQLSYPILEPGKTGHICASAYVLIFPSGEFSTPGIEFRTTEQEPRYQCFSGPAMTSEELALALPSELQAHMRTMIRLRLEDKLSLSGHDTDRIRSWNGDAILHIPGCEDTRIITTEEKHQ